MSEIKKGDILIAIDNCMMSNGDPTLVIGKEYVVTRVSHTLFGFNDEHNDFHWFIKNNYEKYFAKKPIENEAISFATWLLNNCSVGVTKEQSNLIWNYDPFGVTISQYTTNEIYELFKKVNS